MAPLVVFMLVGAAADSVGEVLRLHEEGLAAIQSLDVEFEWRVGTGNSTPSDYAYRRLGVLERQISQSASSRVDVSTDGAFFRCASWDVVDGKVSGKPQFRYLKAEDATGSMRAFGAKSLLMLELALPIAGAEGRGVAMASLRSRAKETAELARPAPDLRRIRFVLPAQLPEAPRGFVCEIDFDERHGMMATRAWFEVQDYLVPGNDIQREDWAERFEEFGNGAWFPRVRTMKCRFSKGGQETGVATAAVAYRKLEVNAPMRKADVETPISPGAIALGKPLGKGKGVEAVDWGQDGPGGQYVKDGGSAEDRIRADEERRLRDRLPEPPTAWWHWAGGAVAVAFVAALAMSCWRRRAARNDS